MRGHTECRPVSICLFQRRRGRLRQCCGRLKSRHRGRITRTHMRTSCKRLASARTVVMHSPPQGHTPHAERHTQKQRDMQMQTQAGARIAMPYSDGDHLAIHPICLFVSVYLSGWLAGSLFLSLSHPPSLLLSLSPLSLSLSTHARTNTHTIFQLNRAAGTHLTSSDEVQGAQRERHPHPLDIAPTNVLDSPQRPCTPW